VSDVRFAILAALLVATAAAAGPDDRPALADASPAVRATLDRLEASSAWPMRAIATLRLEGYSDGASRDRLVARLADDAWQVRAFAVRALGRRREPAPAAWLASEEHPRVVRAVLRHRYAIDAERLGRGVHRLARSRGLDDRMLAAELGVVSGDDELSELAHETVRTVILRMGRGEGGALSSRLAVLTGETGIHRTHRWQRWLLKTGRSFALRPAFAVDASGAPAPLSGIAALPDERFAALEDYLGDLGTREVDLAICIDCTASMSGELAAAQAGIDDLMRFVGDVTADLRVGLVAYRDRNDRDFETKGWDLTHDVEAVRRRLWSLSAAGGGDRREAVHPALDLAFTRLSWDPDRVLVLVLVGDAPPHVGFGAHCVALARRGAEKELTTHVIQASPREIDHFAAIAEAGGGECVVLEEDDRLVPRIAGLAIGDAFEEELRELFAIYLELCR
jgi:hypothetical protein